MALRGEGLEYKNCLLLLTLVYVLDIAAYIVDLGGLVTKNLNYFGFKCVFDLPSVVLQLTIHFLFFSALLVEDLTLESDVQSFLTVAVAYSSLQFLAWLGLGIAVYCLIHSPQFQFTYYLSLRGLDIDEDEKFKDKYFN